jgi:hypothetical protein
LTYLEVQHKMTPTLADFPALLIQSSANYRNKRSNLEGCKSTL